MLSPYIYSEEMDANFKEYAYVFQIQDYEIHSKSQFSNSLNYERKVSMTKVFDSLASSQGVTLKFMINPIAQLTVISYNDLLAVLGGFWTSIMGILALVYLAYWKCLHPMISKCRRKQKKVEDFRNFSNWRISYSSTSEN